MAGTLRIPEYLRTRPALDREEFLGTYFDAGPLRDAARALWRFLEEDLGVDPRGLHPDDELSRLLEFETEVDSLRTVETVIAIEDLCRGAGIAPRPDGTLGTAREVVLRLADRKPERT